MLVSAAMTGTSLQLTGHYRRTEKSIHESMIRVATGTRFQRPADSIAGYFRSQQFRLDIKGQQQIQRELSFGAALLDSAKEVGTTVFEDLTKMQELMKSYRDPNATDDDRTAAQIEFNVIKNRITDTLANAYYDDRKLVADNGATPLMSMILDPRDVSLTYDIIYDGGDVTDATGLTLGIGGQAAEEAALQAQLDHAASYLAKSVVYSDAVASHQGMLAQKNVNYRESVNNNESTDSGAEIMALVRKELNQYMNVSMLAQANMFRSAIAALVNPK
jgi:flagellin-like hook-associated protein FlgL